jgi:Uma2 family endonuclease
MQVTLPEQALPAKLTLNPKLRIQDDDEYWEFCAVNPDIRFERTAQGEIVIVPPVGGEGDYRNMGVSGQLYSWSRKDRRGKTFGIVEFILPSGAALSPDASWVSNGRLGKLTKEQRRKFLRLCPEFVAEVMSPSDRLKDAKEKMAEWMANGVQLGWLIDGDRQTVYVYRADRSEPEKRTGIKRLAGEGPIAGLVLDLADIWAGL